MPESTLLLRRREALKRQFNSKKDRLHKQIEERERDTLINEIRVIENLLESMQPFFNNYGLNIGGAGAAAAAEP